MTNMTIFFTVRNANKIFAELLRIGYVHFSEMHDNTMEFHFKPSVNASPICIAITECYDIDTPIIEVIHNNGWYRDFNGNIAVALNWLRRGCKCGE